MGSSFSFSLKTASAALLVVMLGVLFFPSVSRAHGDDSLRPANVIGAQSSSTTQEQERAKRTASSSATIRQKALDVAAVKGVEMSFKMALNRLNAAAERLTNISDRTKTRLDKLTAEGVSTTKANALLVTANGKIADAKAKIALVVKPTAPTDPSANGARDAYKAAFETMRKQIKTADQAIHDAQKALEDVVKEMKRVGKGKENKEGPDPHASSTSASANH